MTRTDDTAIDQASDHWHDLTARHRHHHFIQQREAFGPAVHPEKNPRLRVLGERRHIGISETGAYARSLLEMIERRGKVLLDELLKTRRAQEEAVFDRIGATLVQQSARTREPPVGVGPLSGIADEGITEPEGAARRVDELTSFEKTRVGTRAGVGAEGFFAYR
jgi:hypothetical protein